jgi:hypothetical protein
LAVIFFIDIKMKLFSKTSIIFYSVLGLITALLIAPFIRSLIDFSTPVEIIITTSIIIPIYIVAKRILEKFI